LRADPIFFEHFKIDIKQFRETEANGKNQNILLKKELDKNRQTYIVNAFFENEIPTSFLKAPIYYRLLKYIVTFYPLETLKSKKSRKSIYSTGRIRNLDVKGFAPKGDDMDDFLYNLRTGNMKNDRNRKNYDNQRYKNADRSNQNNRRKPPQQYQQTNEILTTIKRTLHTLLENQKHLTEICERSARSEERQADALEAIAIQLNALVSGNGLLNAAQKSKAPAKVVQVETATESPEASAQPVDQDHRQHVVEIITELLNKGATYGQIANHLQSEGVATMTGRGNWRPQTVSRLYQQTL
jgi:hypothetical protein